VEGTATAEEVEAVGRVAARWPGARIVIAHFGSPAVDRTLAVLRDRPNLYADLCPVVGEPVRLSRDSFAGLERRILFGSDTPTVAVTIEDSIARVRSWKLDPEHEEAILGGTANGLLGLPG
jgi:predicted TIM-barrel fold metal-dependent hydrolase